MCKCDICDSVKNLVFGQNTLFDEYNFICEECLQRLSFHEFEPSCEEVALYELNALNLSDDQIYGFTVEGDDVVVEWFNKGTLTKTVLVKCDSNDEAIDVLCAIC